MDEFSIKDSSVTSILSLDPPRHKSMKNKKQSWEEKLGEKINYIADAGFELGDYETADMLIKFIRQLLATEYERGRHDNVIDISTWKNLGEARGYDKFLEKQERLNCPYCNPNTSYGASPEFFDQWKIKHEYHKTN